MGAKIKNTYYSDKDIWSVLKRKGYERVEDDNSLCTIYMPTFDNGSEYKTLSIYDAFKKVIGKKLGQTKQEFLDSL